MPSQRCAFVPDRLAWRIEGGRAVRARYSLHRESGTGRRAELPEVLPRSESGLEVAVIPAFVIDIDATGWTLSAEDCYAWVVTTPTHTVLPPG